METQRVFFLKWFFITLCTAILISCADDEDPLPAAEEDNLVQATLKGTRSAAELRFFIEVSGMDLDPGWFANDVDIYEVIYTTRYRDEEIDASGLVLLPRTNAALPMVSFQRGTVVRRTEAPSKTSLNSEAIISAAALSSTGFITVIPDLLGFGESDEVFHPYYLEEPTAIAVIDLLRAAAALAEEKEVEFDERLFLTGYSQGGYATLATHKALEAEPVKGFNLIASFPGAGGYDLSALQSHFFSLDTYGDPYYLAYLAMAYQSWYDEENLVANFFQEPYAEKIPGLFDGSYSAAQINGALTNDIPALIHPDVLAEEDATSAFLREKFLENSLTDWTPAAPVFMYHGDADVTVPYENSELAYETFLENGTPEGVISLTTLSGDHNTAVIPYIVAVITKIQEMK